MNISDIKATLPILLKNNIVPYLHGAQGVGKTQVVRQLASDMGIGFVVLYLSNLEVGDLIGLLDRNENGEVYHMRPTWFPTEGKGIIFLDEFNRAHPDVLQAMLPFALDKTLHTHKLPPGWQIICAGNYNNNSFNVTDISDAALVSRFCHLDFKPSAEEFIAYAESKKAFSVADFIRHHKPMLEKDSASFDAGTVTPDRRSWLDMIAKLENESSIEAQRYEVYAGIVGTAAASSFMSHKKKAEASLDINRILGDYASVREKVLATVSDKKDVRLDYLNQPADELIAKIKLGSFDLDTVKLANLKQFILDIPMELAAKLLKGLGQLNFTGKTELLNDVEFCKLIAEKTGFNKKLKEKLEDADGSGT
jgi:MoxR-like ATPase